MTGGPSVGGPYVGWTLCQKQLGPYGKWTQCAHPTGYPLLFLVLQSSANTKTANSTNIVALTIKIIDYSFDVARTAGNIRTKYSRGLRVHGI